MNHDLYTMSLAEVFRFINLNNQRLVQADFENFVTGIDFDRLTSYICKHVVQVLVRHWMQVGGENKEVWDKLAQAKVGPTHLVEFSVKACEHAAERWEEYQTLFNKAKIKSLLSEYAKTFKLPDVQTLLAHNAVNTWNMLCNPDNFNIEGSLCAPLLFLIVTNADDSIIAQLPLPICNDKNPIVLSCLARNLLLKRLSIIPDIEEINFSTGKFCERFGQYLLKQTKDGDEDNFFWEGMNSLYAQNVWAYLQAAPNFEGIVEQLPLHVCHALIGIGALDSNQWNFLFPLSEMGALMQRLEALGDSESRAYQSLLRGMKYKSTTPKEINQLMKFCGERASRMNKPTGWHFEINTATIDYPVPNIFAKQILNQGETVISPINALYALVRAWQRKCVEGVDKKTLQNTLDAVIANQFVVRPKSINSAEFPADILAVWLGVGNSMDNKLITMGSWIYPFRNQPISKEVIVLMRQAAKGDHLALDKAKNILRQYYRSMS